MDAAHAAEPPVQTAPSESDAPLTFLVSTTGCAGDLARHLGDADYSYGFVLKQLAPVLEVLGQWRRVAQPASSLPFAIERTKAQGRRPVHLALNPPQNCYFTPAAPTILFPFWEFPRIPDRDFGFDTRQNWARMCQGVDLIITAAHSTAEALRRGGIKAPIVVAPVPTSPEFFEIPRWNGRERVTIECRHHVFEGERDVEAPAGCQASVAAPPAPVESPSRLASWGARALGFLRRRVSATWADRLTEARRRALAAHPKPGGTLRRVAFAGRQFTYETLRHIYHGYFCRWLSVEAVMRIHGLKNLVVRHKPELPLLPRGSVTLEGLVYTSVFNLSDRRKNFEDMLSGFLLAFQDRDDVTLVLKLATNPAREYHEMAVLGQIYRSLGIRHRCRIVVITDYLSDVQMRDLVRATTYYLTTTRAEGACLPLQEALAAGRPGLAPSHTAMADYIDDDVAFVLETNPEPTWWPHDPARALETYWNRLVWSNLYDQLRESAEVAENDFARYRRMADAARRRMLEFGSRQVVVERWREALAQLPVHTQRRFGWVA